MFLYIFRGQGIMGHDFLCIFRGDGMDISIRWGMDGEGLGCREREEDEAQAAQPSATEEVGKSLVEQPAGTTPERDTASRRSGSRGLCS